MTNWTHVKDFVPTTRGRYLVARADGTVEIAQLFPAGIATRVEWFLDRDSDIYLEDVTHWAPLPKHPSEGK